MGQGFQINNFWKCLAFASAILKDGGRQYKCHNILKIAIEMLMTLDGLVDNHINQCTFNLEPNVI